VLGDIFAICETILDVQAYRILDVLDGFLIGFTLAVTPLECRARNKVAVRIRLHDDGKGQMFHIQIIDFIRYLLEAEDAVEE